MRLGSFLSSASITLIGLLPYSAWGELTVMGDDTLRAAVQQGDSVVVTISTVRCEPCDNMISTLTKLSEEMESISFSNIRGELDPGLMDDLRITEYPTTIMFHRGHPEYYMDKDNADEEAVRKFIDGVLATRTVNWLKSAADVAGAIRTVLDEKRQVLYVAELVSRDSDGAAVFEEAATNLKSMASYYAFENPNVAKETVRVYRPSEGIIPKTDVEEPQRYRPVGTLSRIAPGRLSKFLRSELVPPFDTPRHMMFYLGQPQVYYAGTADEIEAMRPILEEVGRKSRPDFAMVALPFPDFEAYAKDVIGMPGPFPQMMAVVDERTYVRRYLFGGQMEGQAIKDFADDALHNRVVRYYRSEEEEAEHGEDQDQDSDVPSSLKRPRNVMKLVHSNIKQTIKANSQHHFFTLLHADWCDACKPAVEAFYRVAREHSDNHHLLFGTFEASRNDPPTREFTSSGIPAIFHASVGSTFSIDHRIPITYDDLMKLVEDSLEGERLMIEEKLRRHFDVDDDDDDDDEEQDEIKTLASDSLKMAQEQSGAKSSELDSSGVMTNDDKNLATDGQPSRDEL